MNDIPSYIWRCTADDDREKEWDSNSALDALIDAEQAIEDGATKVVIERIPDLRGRTAQVCTERQTKATP